MTRQTEIMFFFDTEDFTCDRSSDAVRDLALLMRGEGVTGHFAIVGLLAKRLVETGRTDVLEALRGHVIGTHSYGHSLHPDICEQSDLEDYDAAYENVARYEGEAIELIAAATGVTTPMFACPPGNSKSYVAMYYYARRGIPFYCDTVAENARGGELSFCGARHIGYTRSLEGMFQGDAPLDFERGVPELLDEWARDRDRVIVYTHPNMAVKREFWDKLNYLNGNLAEFGKWIQAEDRTPEETAAFYESIRRFVRAVKSDRRFKITNLNELLAAEPERRRVTREDIPAVLAALNASFAPVREPRLSISEAFCAAVSFVRGEREYLPGATAAKGFLRAPSGIAAPVSVGREAVFAAARGIDISDFLPADIDVGGVTLGAADFLLAMLNLLSGGGESITLYPREQLNDLSAFPALRDFRLRSTWVHLPTLRDDCLSDRLRLQAWTLLY